MAWWQGSQHRESELRGAGCQTGRNLRERGKTEKGSEKPSFFRVNFWCFFGGVCFVCCFFFQNMVKKQWKTNTCVEHTIQNGDVFLFLFYSWHWQGTFKVMEMWLRSVFSGSTSWFVGVFLWVWSSSAISHWRFSKRPRWHYSTHVIIFNLCICYSMLQHMQHIWWCHLVRLSQGVYNSQIRVLLWTASNPLSLTERCQKISTAPFFWFWFASHNPHTGPMSQCYVPWNGRQWKLNLTYSPSPCLRVLGPFHNLP